MNAFLRTQLSAFAKKNPSIEMIVSPKPHQHPKIIGHFVNGKTREMCVKNMTPEQVKEQVVAMRDASGEKLVKLNKPVTSLNESVRGIWSPFHGARVKI